MRVLMIGAVIGALFLAACGGDSDDKQIRAVVDQQIDALNKGDGEKLYNVFSRRCRDENPKEAFVTAIKDFRAELGEAKFAVKDFTILEKQAEAAKVRFVLEVRDLPEGADSNNDPVESDVVKEDGKWRSADCGLGVG